jgi:curved DNA-binding protein
MPQPRTHENAAPHDTSAASHSGGYAEPRAGKDVERRVVLTMQEAYRGTTRVLIKHLASGKEQPMEVMIPPGVATGTRVRFAGHGLSGRNGGSPGDLYLVIDVQESPYFQRDGDDLFHALAVPSAVLERGGEVRVQTVDKKLLGLTIPPGTKDGQRFRLTGHGMPRLKRPDQWGDLYVTVTTQLPDEPEGQRKGTAHSWDRDDTFALLFFLGLFLAGVFAGLSCYRLFFD